VLELHGRKPTELHSNINISIKSLPGRFVPDKCADALPNPNTQAMGISVVGALKTL
jgi:hypothetical protein